jgi:hypothetical protein
VSIDLDIPAEWPRRTLEHIGMKKQEAGQPNVAVRKNAEFFAENDIDSENWKRHDPGTGSYPPG